MVGNGSPRGRGRGDSWGKWTRACSGSRARSTSTTRCAARPGVAAGGRRHGRRRFHGAPAAILRRKANDPETGREKTWLQNDRALASDRFRETSQASQRPRPFRCALAIAGSSMLCPCCRAPRRPRVSGSPRGGRGYGGRTRTPSWSGAGRCSTPGSARWPRDGRQGRAQPASGRAACAASLPSRAARKEGGAAGGSLLFCPQRLDRARCCNALESL